MQDTVLLWQSFAPFITGSYSHWPHKAKQARMQALAHSRQETPVSHFHSRPSGSFHGNCINLLLSLFSCARVHSFHLLSVSRAHPFFSSIPLSSEWEEEGRAGDKGGDFHFFFYGIILIQFPFTWVFSKARNARERKKNPHSPNADMRAKKRYFFFLTLTNWGINRSRMPGAFLIEDLLLFRYSDFHFD